MSYFIGYLPPENVQEFYEVLTKKLAETFGIRNIALRAPAHLTLIPPFETGAVEVIENRIVEYANARVTMPLILHGYGQFMGKRGTIYVDVPGDSVVQQFAEDFISTFSDLKTETRQGESGITLHMSVARHLNEELQERIWEHLRQKLTPHFEVSFDNITLFQYENDRWGAHRTFLLT